MARTSTGATNSSALFAPTDEKNSSPVFWAVCEVARRHSSCASGRICRRSPHSRAVFAGWKGACVPDCSGFTSDDAVSSVGVAIHGDAESWNPISSRWSKFLPQRWPVPQGRSGPRIYPLPAVAMRRCGTRWRPCWPPTKNPAAFSTVLPRCSRMVRQVQPSLWPGLFPSPGPRTSRPSIWISASLVAGLRIIWRKCLMNSVMKCASASERRWPSAWQRSARRSSRRKMPCRRSPGSPCCACSVEEDWARCTRRWMRNYSAPSRSRCCGPSPRPSGEPAS